MDKFKVSKEKQEGTEEHNNGKGHFGVLSICSCTPPHSTCYQAKINLLTRSTATGDPYPKGDGANYPKTGDSLVCHYEVSCPVHNGM